MAKSLWDRNVDYDWIKGSIRTFQCCSVDQIAMLREGFYVDVQLNLGSICLHRSNVVALHVYALEQGQRRIRSSNGGFRQQLSPNFVTKWPRRIEKPRMSSLLMIPLMWKQAISKNWFNSSSHCTKKKTINF